MCKVCIHFKKKESGEDRYLGTKNMLDHLSDACLLLQVHVIKVIALVVPVRLRALIAVVVA